MYVITYSAISTKTMAQHKSTARIILNWELWLYLRACSLRSLCTLWYWSLGRHSLPGGSLVLLGVQTRGVLGGWGSQPPDFGLEGPWGVLGIAGWVVGDRKILLYLIMYRKYVRKW